MSTDHKGDKTKQGSQPDSGEAMHGLMTELYPICRSITGEGVRQTLRMLQRHIPLEIHEVPTGTRFSIGRSRRNGISAMLISRMRAEIG